jgi:hypothetical protein
MAETLYTMGIKDVHLRRLGVVVPLLAAQEMTVSGKVVTGELRGRGRIVAVNSYMEAAEVKFGTGGIPLAAFAILFGIEFPAFTGSSPNRVRTMPIPSAQFLPYFEIIGRSGEASGGDAHIYLPRVKVTSGFDIAFQDGANFAAPQMTGMAVPTEASPYPFIFYEYESPTEIAFPSVTTVTLTDIDVADNIATATSGSAHGFAAGQWIGVSGASAGYVNGMKQVITGSGSTFTFLAFGANVTNLTGTATAGV